MRAFGGVLEHPANSKLFRHCRLPWPGELPDEFGGRTYAVRQVSWGHLCEKPTWLYVVGVDPLSVARAIRVGGEPSRRVTNGPRGPQLPRATAAQIIHTPPAFVDFLISIAQSVPQRNTKNG